MQYICLNKKDQVDYGGFEAHPKHLTMLQGEIKQEKESLFRLMYNTDLFMDPSPAHCFCLVPLLADDWEQGSAGRMLRTLFVFFLFFFWFIPSFLS